MYTSIFINLYYQINQIQRIKDIICKKLVNKNFYK